MTQKEIADHLCMSDRNYRDVKEKIEVGPDDTLDDIRSKYIQYLRALASQHKSSSGDDLVSARVRNETISADLKLLQLQEKRGQLIDAEVFYHIFEPAISQIKSGLMNLSDTLARDISTQHNITVDASLISDRVEQTLSELSHYESRSEYDESVAQATEAA